MGLRVEFSIPKKFRLNFFLFSKIVLRVFEVEELKLVFAPKHHIQTSHTILININFDKYSYFLLITK